MKIDNITESLISMYADLSLHFVRSNRFHAVKGNNNLLIDVDHPHLLKLNNTIKIEKSNTENNYVKIQTGRVNTVYQCYMLFNREEIVGYQKTFFTFEIT